MVQDDGGTSIRNTSGTVSVPVWATVMPETVAEVAEAIRRSTGRLSASGARLSPDAQFALAGALHLDLSRLNRVIRFEPVEPAIRVQAGARWSDLLRFIQPHGFAPFALPQFADLSIGGSVAMNATGRGVGVGPVGAAVRALRVVLADGSIVDTSPHERPELFSALVGGLGGLGVIVEVDLRLARNVRLLRKSAAMPVEQYVDHFKARIASDPGAVFHQAVFSLPSFERLRSTTWVQTEERCTDDRPLHYAGIDEPLRRVFDRPGVPGWIGRLRDRMIVEPLQHARKVVRWRNFEASQPVTTLDPRYFSQPELELQQFVVAVAGFNRFIAALREIVGRYRVPVATLSVTHYGASRIAELGFAADDGFAVLLGVPYREPDSLHTDHAAWSRELIDAAIACGGGFHPGYAMHATPAQFRAAFAGVDRLLATRAAVDPDGRFGNGAWTAWLETGDRAEPSGGPAGRPSREPADEVARSEFHALFAEAGSRDMAFRILADCGPAGYGPRLFGLLQRMIRRNSRDELIYRNLRAALAKWRASPWAALTMRPTGWERELHRRLAQRIADAWQRMAPPGAGERLDGLIEVGSGGRQAAALRRRLKLQGPVLQLGLDGRDPLVEAGGGWPAVVPARVVPQTGLAWGEAPLPPASADLVTLSTGLAALAPALADRVLAALAAALRPGGLLVLLEHDADGPRAALEAAMAVSLAALCAGESWEASEAHPRAFLAADDWIERLARFGLEAAGPRERILRTPYGDTLMVLRRR